MSNAALFCLVSIDNTEQSLWQTDNLFHLYVLYCCLSNENLLLFRLHINVQFALQATAQDTCLRERARTGCSSGCLCAVRYRGRWTKVISDGWWKKPQLRHQS